MPCPGNSLHFRAHSARQYKARSAVNIGHIDKGCNFAYGDLSNTYLKGCALTDNRMIEALLDNACLEAVDFTGSDLSNIHGKGMSLVGADLRGAIFNNLNPRDIDLTGVRITLDQALWLIDPLGVVIEP